jgi:hypothetical protein
MRKRELESSPSNPPMHEVQPARLVPDRKTNPRECMPGALLSSKPSISHVNFGFLREVLIRVLACF